MSKEPQVTDGVLKKKVHYVGYSHDFDEWVPVNEIINTSPLILPGVMSDVVSILRFRMKESLYLKRRMDTTIILNQAISLQTCLGEFYLYTLQLSRYFHNVPLSIQQMKDLFLTYFMMTFGSVAF